MFSNEGKPYVLTAVPWSGGDSSCGAKVYMWQEVLYTQKLANVRDRVEKALREAISIGVEVDAEQFAGGDRSCLEVLHEDCANPDEHRQTLAKLAVEETLSAMLKEELLAEIAKKQ